jgi:hypothetical protein
VRSVLDELDEARAHAQGEGEGQKSERQAHPHEGSFAPRNGQASRDCSENGWPVASGGHSPSQAPAPEPQ